MKIKLNLIPGYRKKEINKQNIFLRIMRWNSEFLMIYIIFILILFSMGYILKLNLETNEIELNPNNIAKFSEFKKYDDNIKHVNIKSEEIKKIQEGQFYWTKLFVKLEEVIPEGITITNISTKDLNVLLVGNANSRDNLLNFKEKVSADDCFSTVELPLSYLVPKENLDFQIALALKENCLK